MKGMSEFSFSRHLEKLEKLMKCVESSFREFSFCLAKAGKVVIEAKSAFPVAGKAVEKLKSCISYLPGRGCGNQLFSFSERLFINK